MAQQRQLINGVAYSWSRISFSVYGVAITGIYALTYKVKREKKDIVASGDEPHARHIGAKEYSGSIELDMKEVERIRDAVRAVGGTDLTDAPASPLIVEFMEGLNTRKHVIKNMEFLEDGYDLKQGENVKVSLPIIYAGIDFN
jgi:hypothetical protein